MPPLKQDVNCSTSEHTELLMTMATVMGKASKTRSIAPCEG